MIQQTFSSTVAEGGQSTFTPDLAAVNNAWPQLPKALKAAILAIVRTAE
jgi:hypothetical protein